MKSAILDSLVLLAMATWLLRVAVKMQVGRRHLLKCYLLLTRLGGPAKPVGARVSMSFRQ